MDIETIRKWVEMESSMVAQDTPESNVDNVENLAITVSRSSFQFNQNMPINVLVDQENEKTILISDIQITEGLKTHMEKTDEDHVVMGIQNLLRDETLIRVENDEEEAFRVGKSIYTEDRGEIMNSIKALSRTAHAIVLQLERHEAAEERREERNRKERDRRRDKTFA